MSNSKQGFSLVELLVVISILAIIAAIGFVIYSTPEQNARDARRKIDLANIQTALEMYMADNGYYPLNQDLTEGSTIASSGNTYLNKIPQDPKSSDYPYQYVCTNYKAEKCTNYCLYAKMENAPQDELNGCQNPGTLQSYNFALIPEGTLQVSPLPSPTSIADPVITPSPTPLGPRRIFVTMGSYTGNIKSYMNGATDGLDAADKLCVQEANGYQLCGFSNTCPAGSWKAWLSSSTVPAKDRMSQALVSYMRLDGVIVANNWSGLISGSLLQPINVMANGNPANTVVWTNTNPTGGVINTPSYSCGNWESSAIAGNGGIGNTTAMTSSWSSYSFVSCSNTNRLYCVEQ